MSEENSGGSCDYYKLDINCPLHLQPYSAECGDIMDALELTPNEANIFKELWRTAASRQGKHKASHTTLRAAEKYVFFANRIHQLVLYRLNSAPPIVPQPGDPA